MAEGGYLVEHLFVDFLLTSFVQSGDRQSCLKLFSRAVDLRCRIRSCTFDSLLNLLIARNRAQDAIFLNSGAVKIATFFFRIHVALIVLSTLAVNWEI